MVSEVAFGSEVSAFAEVKEAKEVERETIG